MNLKFISSYASHPFPSFPMCYACAALGYFSSLCPVCFWGILRFLFYAGSMVVYSHNQHLFLLSDLRKHKISFPMWLQRQDLFKNNLKLHFFQIR